MALQLDVDTEWSRPWSFRDHSLSLDLATSKETSLSVPLVLLCFAVSVLLLTLSHALPAGQCL